MESERPLLSPNELVRQGIAPPPLEEIALRSLPFPPDVTVSAIPPIDVGEIPDDAPLAERIALHSSSPSAGFSPSKTARKRFRLAALLALVTSRRGIGYSISVIVHLALFIFLAVIVLQIREGRLGEPVNATFSGDDRIEATDLVGETPDAGSPASFSVDLPSLLPPDAENLTPDQQLALLADMEWNNRPVKLGDLPVETEIAPSVPSSAAENRNEIAGVPFFRKGTTSGRNAATRKSGLPGREGDTTDASEMAVERGLHWLAEHQLPDGGWSFSLVEKDDNDRPGSCQGQCSNSVATSSGSHYRSNLYPSRTAATGIALLPFLGAGYTHQAAGEYQQTVLKGLEFLKYRAIVTDNGIDFREPGERFGMYTQAIVAVTLCEAFEMTKDPQLRHYARESVRLIEKSQREDGGWRYEARGDSNFFPHIPGDTSVTGWQMLAIKSAISSGMELEPAVLYQVGHFLETVALDGGSLYRYQWNTGEPESSLHGTTAVGLLVREYLGWGPDQKAVRRGIHHLDNWFDDMENDWKFIRRGKVTAGDRPLLSNDGRILYNLYYSYYALLVLHHAGGKEWKDHFPQARDFLIATQSDGQAQADGRGSPHEAGSWLFFDRYMNDGGRLLNTALSVLILETPYRYLPMYQTK